MRIYSYKQTPKNSSKERVKRKRTTGSWNFRNWGLRKILTWTFRLVAIGIFLFALLFLYYSKDLPDPNKLLTRDVPESTKIFARDGTLLYEIHGETKRTLVELGQVATTLKQATIATEDKSFYTNNGISITGILRSVLVDVLSGSKKQGASTITQQFVKNAILSKDKSFDRKIKEIILAMAIDARFSKDQILKFYLNEIPFGRNAYGVEAASQTYFGKPAKDLDLAESAYLAALPQAPTYYNPLGPNRKALDDRKNYILSQMQQQGYINKEQQRQAAGEKVEFSKITTGITAPHFVLMVQDYLANKFGEKTLEEGGLKVYTTLDPKLQKIAEDAVEKGVEQNAKKYNSNNASLVAIDPKTGQILALVGSKDYFGDPVPAGCSPGKNCLFEPNVNVALSERQPGSSFKPYVYVTAFKKDYKYTPASLLFDVVTNFGTYAGKEYIPQNYSGLEYGPLPMRKTLAGSLNVPAVKTLDLIGVNNAVQTARDLGITSPLANCGLSLVLGGCEVKLIDHVAAFAALANRGLKNDKTPILKIVGKDGKTIEEYQNHPTQVVDPQAVYELTSIMTDNSSRSFIFGPNSPLILPGRPVAAKTGTTQNWHDGWTLGFTPSLAAGVWAGNNDGTFLAKGADGVLVAAPIWHNFMQEALKDTPAEDFPVPPGITSVTVDELSGKLPTQYTPSTKSEVFADYAVPTDYDDIHINVPTDSLTDQPANNLTPPERIVNKIYTILHSERPNNPNWENPVVAWALAHGYTYPLSILKNDSAQQTPPAVNISQPQDGSLIFKLPLTISAATDQPNQIIRMEIWVDGQLTKSQTTAPFDFVIDQNYSDGQHVFAVKAINGQGQVGQSSITVTLSLTSPLLMTNPAKNGQLSLPVTLQAQSAAAYSQVGFYYETSKGTEKFIGSSPANAFNQNYQYTFNWSAKLNSGTYKLYVKGDSGSSSPKIKIIVP